MPHLRGTDNRKADGSDVKELVVGAASAAGEAPSAAAKAAPTMTIMLLWVAWVYAAYFLLTGIWPIVHMSSFLAVTGPKTDLWLVRTVGLLVMAVGLAVGVAAARDQLPLPVFVLAVASSLSLLLIDLIYVGKRVIAKIYLLDAAVEVVLIIAWIVGWFARP